MVRDALETILKTAIKNLAAESPDLAILLDIPFEIGVPKSSGHGDFSINFAMVAAKSVGMNPRAFAERLVTVIESANSSDRPEATPSSAPSGASSAPVGKPITKIEIAGPGFINLTLDPAWVAGFVSVVIEQRGGYSRPSCPNPQKINVEFVSVNPNGPITIGSGRGAAFGSTLCNVLEHAGHTVHREYYINDGVNSEQMRLFAESVRAIMRAEPIPDNGYKGDYVHDVARRLGTPGQIAEIDAELESVLEFYKNRKDILAQQHQDALNANPNGIEGQKLEHLSQVAVTAWRFWQNQSRLRLDQTVPVDGETAVDPTDIDQIRAAAQLAMILRQYRDLQAFNVNFDVWFSEQSLHDSSAVNEAVDHLQENNVADESPYRIKLQMAKGGIIKDVEKEVQPTDEDDAEGASPTFWLRSTKFGDDQDRVLRRKDGRLTYIASDVAYHKDKFNRPPDADKLITVLGPDHHGYIGRLQAVVAAIFSDEVEPLTNDAPLSEHEAALYTSKAERNQCQAALKWAKEHLEVQIFQLVRFIKDGKPAPMRKRDGNIYALLDLINEIGEQVRPNSLKEDQQQAGSDVARFFYLMRHHDTAMDFDLELATKQSDENPVFYVQYANARIQSVIAKGKEAALTSKNPNLALLTDPRETALILKIADLPNEVNRTAEDYSVNRLTTYSLELARVYHSFYDACKVVSPDNPELSTARLALCEATSIAIQSALGLLGVSAPNELRRAAVVAD